MESLPTELPYEILRQQYQERRAALPDILNAQSASVELGGRSYDIEAYSINPYAEHLIATDTWECDPLPLREGHYRLNHAQQVAPQQYLALMTAYREKGDRTCYTSTWHNCSIP